MNFASRKGMMVAIQGAISHSEGLLRNQILQNPSDFLVFSFIQRIQKSTFIESTTILFSMDIKVP